MNPYVIALGVAALAFLFTKKASASTSTVIGDITVTNADEGPLPYETLGELQHNPGNIRANSVNNWQGKTGSHAGYEIFNSDDNGMRALAVLLHNYYANYQLNNVRAIITRYAPPTDKNPTEDYIANVSHSLGVFDNSIIALSDHDTLVSLMRAIVHQEQGRIIYPDSMFNDAATNVLGE